MVDHAHSYDAASTPSAPSAAPASASSIAPAAAAPSVAEPAADAPAPAQPDPDIIRWPDEEPPPPEMWEIAPVHEWEREERGYIFEQRLEGAEVHKAEGNAHFRAAEWELALRRYKRAIYFCHFDEMQMYDLLEHHKEQAHGIQVPCKLNLAACIVRMHEDADPALPDGSLDHALQAIAEVLKARPKEAKAFFRRGQVLMLQQDLPGAREALNEAAKIAGSSGGMRETFSKLKELEKKEKERQRELYGGTIQSSSLHRTQEAAEAAALARRMSWWKAFRILGGPVILPLEMLFALVLAMVQKVRGTGMR